MVLLDAQRAGRAEKGNDDDGLACRQLPDGACGDIIGRGAVGAEDAHGNLSEALPQRFSTRLVFVALTSRVFDLDHYPSGRKDLSEKTEHSVIPHVDCTTELQYRLRRITFIDLCSLKSSFRSLGSLILKNELGKRGKLQQTICQSFPGTEGTYVSAAAAVPPMISEEKKRSKKHEHSIYHRSSFSRTQNVG